MNEPKWHRSGNFHFSLLPHSMCVCVCVCVLKAIITPDEAAPHTYMCVLCMCVVCALSGWQIWHFCHKFLWLHFACVSVCVCVLCMDTLPLRIVVIVVVTYCCCCCCCRCYCSCLLLLFPLPFVCLSFAISQRVVQIDSSNSSNNDSSGYSWR